MTMNEKHQAALEAIIRAVDSNGYPPTMRELATSLDVSVATARSYIDRLAADGHITVDWGKPRAIKVNR